MYKSFDVWKKTGTARLVRYRCFEDTDTGKFCVQSADLYNLPIQIEQLVQSEKQFLELMIEESPFVRSCSFDTAEEAIAHHDSEFLNT
jgi:hypothetical protein